MPNLQEAIQQTEATLCAHSGAMKINREDLYSVATPKGTDSWKPIPHSMLVDTIEETLRRNHFRIAKEEYAVQTEGAKLFGVMTLESTESDYALALGLRTSNDKSFPVQMIAGARVFVCDNLAFSGSVVTLKRRHTSRLDIQVEVAGGIQRAIGKFQEMGQSVQRMKEMDLTGKDVVAKAKICDAAVRGVMPLRLVPDVYKNYFEPKHEEFAPRNAWSLHNAFTESFKLLKPNVAMQSGVELGKLFNV
jgi:Domain of unknown function (DUF932)